MAAPQHVCVWTCGCDSSGGLDNGEKGSQHGGCMQDIGRDQCRKEAQQQPGTILVAGSQCLVELLGCKLYQRFRKLLIVRV